MNKKKIVVTPGDGIGPEVIEQALIILKEVSTRFQLELEVEEMPVGGTAYDQTGTPIPDETLKACLDADAVLLGAVGGPKWEPLDFSVRPERGLLKLRSELQLYANLRPAVIYGDLVDASTLKRDVVEGADLMVIRELTGGIYFGEPRGVEERNGERVGFNTLVYSESEIRRVGKMACEIAMKRNKKLTSVDKANVLESTELWREVMTDVVNDFPEIDLNHMYADNAAMQLIRDPKQFDTMVTTNMFGDILSDQGGGILGSLGLMPSACVGPTKSYYEPSHGSAPDIAGKNIANPYSMIGSVAMMLEMSFEMAEEAKILWQSMKNVFESGISTADLRTKTSDEEIVSTSSFGDKVIQNYRALLGP